MISIEIELTETVFDEIEINPKSVTMRITNLKTIGLLSLAGLAFTVQA